jgi:hypothetical protein
MASQPGGFRIFLYEWNRDDPVVACKIFAMIKLFGGNDQKTTNFEVVPGLPLLL